MRTGATQKGGWSPFTTLCVGIHGGLHILVCKNGGKYAPVLSSPLSNTAGKIPVNLYKLILCFITYNLSKWRILM